MPGVVTNDEWLSAIEELLGDNPNVVRQIQEDRLLAAAWRANDFFDSVRSLAEWSAKGGQIPDNETVDELTAIGAKVLAEEPNIRKIHEDFYRQRMASLAVNDAAPDTTADPSCLL